MLRLEGNLGPEAEIHVVGRLEALRLRVQDPDIGVADPLGHDDPHPLSLNDDAPILVGPLDVEDELGRLAAFQIFSSFPRWDAEGLGMVLVRAFGRAQLPEVPS
jgi:hypothetical protein